MSSQIQALEPKIRQILSAQGTDLSTISAKRVRKQLLELDPSLSPDFVKEKKDEIDDVIAKVYEQVSAVHNNAGGDDDDDDASSKRKRDDASDDEPAAAPAKKTKKGKTKQEKTDEEIARQLQNEINGRARSSRAGSSSKKANGAKRGKKAKSSTTVGSGGEEAESEGEGKKKRGGGFKKEYMLSEPLATLLGVEKLSRPQIVKQLWDHIKANNMQNPENKKEIICDDQFRAIFKVDRIDMFKMNKELGQHLYEPPVAS
ncbi:SWIB-domain-containing protein [Ganoderma leucocontextum]|nr:SWIB-domain-containing protein [Ganoderma leucocontextum]KAI1785231.1 SWIB-domain-containing protein [Ganoderma leucocontextum]